MTKHLLPLLLALSFPAAALAAPAQVILIRHAEKPAAGNQLSEKGWRRAEALAWFFQTNSSVTRHGTPAAIYAAAPKHEDSSVRSIQTVTPLAKALKLDIDVRFTRGQTRKLARDLLENPAYTGRMVLISWQHEALVEIVRDLAELGGTAGSLYLPEEWPDEVYDRLWILDLSRGKVASFRDLPQNLLPGDSSRTGIDTEKK